MVSMWYYYAMCEGCKGYGYEISTRVPSGAARQQLTPQHHTVGDVELLGDDVAALGHQQRPLCADGVDGIQERLHICVAPVLHKAWCEGSKAVDTLTIVAYDCTYSVD